MSDEEIKDFLNEKTILYNQPGFIESDPIQIPHRFSLKEDIEIAAFFAATLAWGNRKMIIKKGNELLDKMSASPYDFILNHTSDHLERISDFQYRTFMPVDLIYFIKALKNIYQNYGGLEGVYSKSESIEDAHIKLYQYFFELNHENRTKKHLANVAKGSAAKRLNMFLRWMVRKDKNGVDFGLWEKIHANQLLIPLDTHTANISRKLGLLLRKQNDWKAVIELTNKLKEFDAKDPIKYDYALFGLGVFEKF